MENENKGIVCTLGPASWNNIKELKDAGMSIARINGSFGLPYKRAIEELKEHNVPVLVDIPRSRTKKRLTYVTDDELIQFVMEHKLDFVGISYVTSAQEINEMREILKDTNVKIIAKIENKEGFNNRREIILAADMVLIDRGDLGTDIGFQKVPKAQIEILADCKILGKKAIIATEMMMSTLKETKPNCADVSDVYHALHHGAHFVMLSEETALGKHPVKTTNIMKTILDESQ